MFRLKIDRVASDLHQVEVGLDFHRSSFYG